jgi:hypothetical protein
VFEVVPPLEYLEAMVDPTNDFYLETQGQLRYWEIHTYCMVSFQVVASLVFGKLQVSRI